MSVREIIVLCLISVVAAVGIVGGCKDNGSQPTNPPAPVFGVAPTSVNLVVGDSSVLTISGGTAPYMVVDTGTTTVATASISGSSLKILAVGVGTSRIVIGDNSAPQLRDSIGVTVSALVSFANDVQPIFTTSCVNAGCHPGGGAPFSLQSGQSYGNLVGVAQTSSPGCSSLQFRVDPNSASNSVLYQRINGSSCGSRMPLGGGSLPTAEINRIRDWINQGALNN